MKYNIAKYGQLTSSGTISFSIDELIEINNSTSATITTGSGSIILHCDLGSRVHIDQIQFYTATSGVSFYYKNESFESYDSLTTYDSGSYYYATMSGSSAPRYIKIEQNISASGTVNGLVIQNNEDYVDFGENAEKTFHNINATIESATEQIDELAVYNSSSKTATAKVFLEPQNSTVDELLSISNSESGPWYGIYQDDDKILGSTIWESASYNNTEVNADILSLSSGQTEGTVTTRIFHLDDNQKLTYPIISSLYPDTSSIIATDAIDTYENIEVRSYNNRPLDFVTIVDLRLKNSNDKYLRHRWALDGALQSEWDTTEVWLSSVNYFDIYYDNITDDVYLIDKAAYTGGNTTIRFHIFKDNSPTVHYETLIYNRGYNYNCYFTTYKLSFNSHGGFWIYYYHGSDHSADAEYFYLDYYNSTIGRDYRRYQASTFLRDMSAVYESNGDLWYTDSDQNAVFKIDKTGAILATKAETDEIRGIAALNDGGCWYIRGSELVRLDSDAEEIDSFDLNTSTASYVYLDPTDNGFWIHDSDLVVYFNSSQEEVFSVQITDLVLITAVTSDGVITKQTDGSTTVAPQASYVSKYHQRVLRTWDYAVPEGGWQGNFDSSTFGAKSYAYDDLTDDHASYFPITPDDAWQNFTEWKKVSLRNYNFNNDEYHQLRITLRADVSVNSPKVYGIWTQRAVELPNILPGNYANFYLKSDTTGLTPDDGGTYASNIRAWWYIEES